MPILSTKLVTTGLSGVKPSIIYIDTDDTLAEVTATGYLNSSVALGVSFNEHMMALVSTKASASAAVTVSWLEVSHVSGNWSLVDPSAQSVLLAEGDLAVGDSNGRLSALSGTSAQIIQYDASANAVAATMSGDVTLSNTAVASVGRVLDGDNVANVADSSVVGGLPVVFKYTTVAGGSFTHLITVTNKIRVYSVVCQLNGTGTAGDLITIQNGEGGPTAITNAMDINVVDTTIVRARDIDDAAATINAGEDLRILSFDGGGSDIPAVEVTIYAMNVA